MPFKLKCSSADPKEKTFKQLVVTLILRILNFTSWIASRQPVIEHSRMLYSRLPVWEVEQIKIPATVNIRPLDSATIETDIRQHPNKHVTFQNNFTRTEAIS